MADGFTGCTAFTTSAGTDGWIGFYAKTTATGWTSQIFLEGASNNGSIEKTLISDGVEASLLHLNFHRDDAATLRCAASSIALRWERGRFGGILPAHATSDD